uniref:Fibronectin type III domain protein n=2 Tax=Haemonchus contortus TaxID=6289 RepID=A0A7I5E8R5_HAECO
FQVMGPFSRGMLVILLFISFFAFAESLRVRRESRGTESLLTVEWEGIQTGDHPETDVKGFLVEYRAEKDKHWMVHSGIIPYKGPNHQYRVQIPKLPTGVAYFVRIKVLGAHNEILVETAEIRARNEIVSIKCESDDLTAPRHLEITHEGQYSLAIKWDAPECGSIGEYQVELIGEEVPFDVHRQTVTQPHVSVTNLLPATNYNIKIRAVDRQRRIGPWNSDLMQARTQGESVPVSNDIRLVYRTDSELHFTWNPISDDRAQHYEVTAVELLPESRRVERARVPPYVSGHTLAGLLPGTKYIIGVIAFADHEPKLVYHLETETTEQPVESWREKPQVVDEEGELVVHWQRPATAKPGTKFVVEYRLPNETFWRSVDEADVEEDGDTFSVSLPPIPGISVFTVRLLTIGPDNEVIGRTEEVTMGEAAANACVGTAGIPAEITVELAEPTVLRFSWSKPDCDESVAPIDGYEYLIHQSDQQTPHSGASYIGGTTVAIPELHPSTRYSFRVRSRNANGHSPWSTVIDVATTPEGSLTDLKPLTLTNIRVLRRQKRQEKHLITDETNHLKVRVVLSPPDVYLVWMPLAQHSNRIALFKVAYKERNSNRWTRIYGCPEDFQCPQSLRLDPVDYCYRLQRLYFGVHYISRVSYNLTDGDVHDPGSTIHFSLMHLAGVEQPSHLQVGLSQPRIEQQGPRNVVYWSTTGDNSRLLGYQVDIRRDGDREWTEHGAMTRVEPSQSHFRQSLGPVPVATYYLRVRAIDGSGNTVATSPSTSFSVSCQTPMSPENVRLDRVSEDRVRISWTFPTEDPACQTYFFISGIQNGAPISHRAPGSERSYDIEGPARGDWRVEVRAVNSAGSGPASQQAIFTSAQQSLVSAPRVEARGNDLHVEWRSEGDGRGVFGYRLQFRTESSGWNPYGQIVPYVGDNQDYSQTLTGLQKGHTYAVHIQVLDRNSYVMYVSPEASARSSCTAPSHPPSHLQVQAPDASHVRVQWALPPQSTWGCADIQYEIQVVEPQGIPPVSVPGGQTSHIFPSRPNQQWSVRIRAKNSAGHSAWTPAAEVRTPPGGELIVGPNIAYRQGNPIITWQSRENVDDQIESFILEWKTTTETEWRQHRNPIPFSGWQRPYTIDLGELPKGHTYQVRIVVRDRNRNIAFTSPIVQVQTQSTCQPPRRAPTNLQVSPIGPTQIRLTWAPLHESEWNCDRMWYIVKYSTPKNQGFKNLTQGENSVVFESDPYTRWSFEVQAANPAGETQWSRTETAQTQDASPGPVVDLRVQPVGPDRLQVSWRPPINPNGLITQYEITYQLVSKGMCDQQQDAPRTLSVTSPNHVITGLHPHSRYRVGVAAKTTIAGERVMQEVQTEQSVPSAPPLYLRVEEARETDASVSWQAPPCLQTNGEITEYEYEVTPADRRAQPQRLANTVRGTRAQITGLQPFTRYNIKVRAYTSRGPGPWSSDVAFQTAATQTVTAPPFVRVINTGADNAHVVWQSPHPQSGYIDKYKCRYSPAGSQNYQERQFPAVSPCQARILESQQLPTPPPGTRMHCGRIDNLQPEQTYDFQVAAHVTDRGWSPWSQPERTKVTDEAVQILTIDKIGGTESSLTISWTVRPGDRNRVTSFRLHVEPVDGSSRAQTFNVDRNTYQYRIDNLRPRTQYNVTVQAATNKELCGGTQVTMWTDAAPLTALAVAPRVIAEEATSVTIEWDSRNREAGGFIVEYKLEGSAWQQHPRRIPAHPAQTTYTATVDGLPTNNVIDLRVRVVSQQNEQSNPSPEVRGRTKCSPPPNPPQGIRVDAPSTNDVRVSWSRPAKDTWMCDQMNVEISYRIGNEPEKILPVPGDQTEYTFPAEPNQRWVIKLRATNQVGSSRWSSEQRVTTRQGAPGAVRDLRVKALSPNEVHVQWLAPLVQRGTIVGYDISYRLKHRLACPEEEPRDVSRDFVTVYNHKDLDYTITGLLPYSLYEVRVRARTTELGPEETKEVSTEQQPPSSPPLNLELTYALERSLSFQWEPVDCSQRHGHIVNYEYEILGQDDWAKLERQIANTSDTEITVDGLTPFTKYIMRVRAYNSIGGGPNTENLDVMTAKASAPLPPQDLVVAQEGTDFFMVSWLPPYPPYGPHDAYKIRYQLLGTDRWEEKQHGVKDEALQCPSESPRFCYNVTGLEPGNQYKVQVATRIEGGTYGPWSSLVIANTLQILPDTPRAIHLIEKTDHSLHIKWVPPIDPKGHITQYKVSIASLDEPNEERKTYLVDHPTLTYLFDGLKPETSYNVSIAAGSKRGFGREIWTRYSTDPFAIPVIVAAPIVTPDGASALDVQWSGVLDSQNRVKGYIIEIRNSDTPIWQEIGGITHHDAVKRSYLKKLTGLDADTLYFVRIKVVDHKQRVGAASPEAQGRTGCAPPTSPPTNVNLASPSNVQVRVNWQAPVKGSWLCSNIRYKLEYINGTQPRTQIDLPSSSIEHIFDSPSNTKWQVRIRTENDAGASGWSNELELTTAEGAPGAVRDMTAVPMGPTSIEASWRPPLDPNGVITGYTLVYNLKSMGECGPRTSTPIQKHVRSETQVLDGLLPDSTYEVHVIAHTSMAGPQSKVITVTTEEAAPTGPPINVRVGSVTSNRADVTWSQPDCELRNGKITGYEYELESLDRWGENFTSQHSTERLTLSDLVPYNEYRIRVRAQNAVGEGPYSEWVRFITHPAAPPAPSDLQEEGAFPHALEISFAAPSPPHGNIDYYRIRHTPSGQLNFKEVRVEAERLQCSDASKRDRLCFRVHDLDPEQDYEIQVAAHTEGGAWSEWSEPLNARTEQQNIPVLERELEVIDTKPESITLRFEGVPQEQAAHVIGYVLEYKSEDDDDWAEYNGVIKHRRTTNDYKVMVRQLETATNYFFRLKVVGKNDKRGAPGPETKAMTSCGRPEEPPSNVRIESDDFESVKITWTPPSEDSWRCDDVEFVIDYVNTTSRGSWTVPVDAPSELLVPTMPGTRWEVKMRTQTVEDGAKPQWSKWSDKASLTTQSLPGELFVTVEPTGSREALVTWDLPDKDQKWNYGVDISYRLKQLGGCNEAATGPQEPITKLNIQEKQVPLEELAPGSVYEVTVTPRRPPSLHSSIVAPKTVRTFKTKNDVPTGPPMNLQSTVRKDTELGFKWDAPECVHQNGNVSQYEFELVGMDEWNEGTREGVTPRTTAVIDQLQPGSLYRMRVRAYTAEGPGPWSDPLEIRTTGSELGSPRELTAVQTKSTAIQLTWLPPYPEKAIVTAYRMRYSPRADDSNPTEVELSGDELSCTGYKSPIITGANLCTTVKNLQPATTYRFAVQGQSASGTWGEWSSDYFSTTRKDDNELLGGSLKLLSAGHDNLKVKWTPPAVIGEKIDTYQLFISVASELDQNPREYTTPGSQTDYHFRQLNSVTQYNVTVQGLSGSNKLWFISSVFATTDFAEGLLNWLPAPTDLHLIEKSDTMLHVDWVPPEIFDPEQRELLTHYRVTIAPFDPRSGVTGPKKNYTVPVPGNSIKFEGLNPETIYNITVQAGTSSGYGHILWGTYSTLAPGQRHIIRLINRSPTTLHVEWEPVWGRSHSGYILTARSLHSVYGNVRINQVKTFDVEPWESDFVIRGLHPSTVYNVTLKPKDHSEVAWGAYATLPPGWFLVKNLKQCDKTNFAVSMSWEPVELDMATHYQVRYLRMKDSEAGWIEEDARESKELLCPKDGCGRLCYLVFNLPHNPSEYIFQVRAKVDGEWNHWRSAPRKVITGETAEIRRSCCIVPPPYMVENIGSPGSWWEVDVTPAATENGVSRYYVVVDERDPPGESNWTELTDKVTANKLKIPYYVAASYDINTLTGPKKVRLGDGTVIGGYLNYPLVKGKKYNYEVYTVWNMTGVPVVGRSRASPYLAAGWPWWWLLLLLLLLLLLILLCCCLLWCLQGRYRTRKEHRRMVTNGQHVPLLEEDKNMEANLRSLESRLDKMRGTADGRSRGDFEDGYMKGYKDANKLGSASAARRRMDDDYGSRDDRFHEGYVKGLKDAGMTGMSTSMHNLAQKGPGGGYSSGFMQGYKDGNSGIFGDRVTPSLISRLDEQYPGQDDFKQGYVDGFKEGAGSRTGERRTFEDSRRLQQSLTELTERLTSLEKTKGDEIHSTKIYHVYNQQPDSIAYTSSAQQLAHELEEINSTSRRSTLRRHYTPGDYLKQASEGEGYGTLGRNRRSLSASALARDSSAMESRTTEQRSRHASGTGSSYITRSAADRQGTDTYSKRYNYRSRSDVGSPRRYASQTLLDGSRPGPSTPHARRDALSTLQRELDTLSRSPDRSTPRGYTSDTGNAYDTVRSKARGYSNYDYDTFSSSRHHETRSSAVGGGGGTTGFTTVPTTRYSAKDSTDDAGRWADDLLEIVSEPMNKTLDRMKKYSSSSANVEGGASTSHGDAKEIVEEKYHRSYKEEHSSGAGR